MDLTMNNLIGVISDSLKIGKNELAEDDSLFDDICIDSIETVQLCRDLNVQFNSRLDVNKLKSMASINELFLVLQKDINQ